MGYRELSRMEIVEVVRRWQAARASAAIARATGLARETVKKYLAAAGTLGLSANGPPPTEEQVVALVRLGSVVAAPRTLGCTGARSAGAACRTHSGVGPGRAAAADARAGVAGAGRRALLVHDAAALRAARSGWGGAAAEHGAHGREPAGRGGRDGLRPAGHAAEPARRASARWSGRWWSCCRSAGTRFVWLTTRQTLEATIEGLEAAWRFFGGRAPAPGARQLPGRDRRAGCARAAADARLPGVQPGARASCSTRRGCATRRTSPTSSGPIRYVRERFWKGGRFSDLLDARRQAAALVP